MKSKPYLFLRLTLLIFAGIISANSVMLSAQINKNDSQAQKINKTNSDEINVLRRQGFAYLQNKNWSGANEIFSKVLLKIPNDYVSLYGNSVALFNLRQSIEAETNLNKAIKLLTARNANNAVLADSLVLLAVINATRKNVDGAIKNLLQAIKFAPKNFDANFTLGRAYFGNGDIGNASVYFKKATEIQPNNLQARFFLATALERNNSLQEALNEYRKVVKLNANYAEGNLGLGVLLINLNGANSVEGLNALKKAVSLKGNLYEARLTLGKTLVKLKRSEEAIEHLQKAVELAPNNPEPHYQLALAYRKTGKKAEAAEQMKIVKKIHSNRRGVSKGKN